MTRRRLRLCALLTILLGLTLSACSEPPPDSGPAMAVDARPTLDRYLAAIADGDLKTATELSSPRALVVPGDEVDITEALPQADSHITAIWVSFLGDDFIYRRGSDGEPTSESMPTVTFQVSYQIAEATAADQVTLARTGEDPAAPEGWTVVDGLIVSSEVVADAGSVPAIAIGEITSPNPSGSITIRGYPARYRVTAAGLAEDYTSEPLLVPLGVELLPTWNSPHPQLEAFPES